METAEKVRENRLRRVASRRGLRLVKSRRRDPRALDYGTYWVVNPSTNLNLSGDLGLQGLDEVERFLDI